MVQINKNRHSRQSVPVRTCVRSRVRRRDLTSRTPKDESGKRENETAGLSGGLLIGDDFLVARLGLGTLRLTGKGIWGEPADRSEAIRVVRRAVELGLNFIDTADSYGPAVSEAIIAEALYPYRTTSIARRQPSHSCPQ
jgi:pyridoxine 4-dehydrogenase